MNRYLRWKSVYSKNREISSNNYMQLQNTEEANCNPGTVFSMERNDTAGWIVRLEWKVNPLITANVSAEDDVQIWKEVAEQDREEYKTRARVLE